MNINLDKNEEIMELEQVLDIVGEKLPKIISGLIDNVYSENAGRQIGKSMGAMYRELQASGMDKEDIMPLVKDYMATMKNSMSKEFSI